MFRSRYYIIIIVKQGLQYNLHNLLQLAMNSMCLRSLKQVTEHTVTYSFLFLYVLGAFVCLNLFFKKFMCMYFYFIVLMNFFKHLDRNKRKHPKIGSENIF